MEGRQTSDDQRYEHGDDHLYAHGDHHYDDEDIKHSHNGDDHRHDGHRHDHHDYHSSAATTTFAARSSRVTAARSRAECRAAERSQQAQQQTMRTEVAKVQAEREQQVATLTERQRKRAEHHQARASELKKKMVYLPKIHPGHQKHRSDYFQEWDFRQRRINDRIWPPYMTVHQAKNANQGVWPPELSKAGYM